MTRAYPIRFGIKKYTICAGVSSVSSGSSFSDMAIIDDDEGVVVVVADSLDSGYSTGGSPRSP